MSVIRTWARVGSLLADDDPHALKRLITVELSISAPSPGRTVVREDSGVSTLRSARGWRMLVLSVVVDPAHPVVPVSL